MLARLRDSGVLVLVFAPSLDNRGALLASAADRVFLPPLGELGLVGISAEMTFFGEALSRLGLRADVEAAGAYKSLGEPLTRRWATPENREATQAIVDDLFDELVEGVAEGRRVPPEQLREMIEAAPFGAEQAEELGLIDGVCYEDGLDEQLEALLDQPARRVPVGGAAWLMRWARRFDEWTTRDPLLVVVHLEGPVTMGQEPNRGQARVACTEVGPVLAALRESEQVEGVVLAVSSPGGSALASDLIWREVELLVREKPVVAWFSDVAASGGYYLSAPVNAIVARPTTLTGSIGVVGFKLVVGEGAGKLGVFSEALERGQNAGLFSVMRPFDASQRDAFRRRLNHTYGVFLQRVSAGRKAPVDAVEEVARGRVWSGRRAKEVGLVDELGGLDQALEAARKLTSLRPGQRVRRQDLVIRAPEPFWMRFVPARASVSALGPAVSDVELMSRHAGEPLALLPLRPRFR